MDKERKTHLADSAAKAAINAFPFGEGRFCKAKDGRGKIFKEVFF